MVHIRKIINECLTIMDERGRSNPECNSRMLWNAEWDIVRGALFRACEHIDAEYSDECAIDTLTSAQLKCIKGREDWGQEGDDCSPPCGAENCPVDPVPGTRYCHAHTAGKRAPNWERLAGEDEPHPLEDM